MLSPHEQVFSWDAVTFAARIALVLAVGWLCWRGVRGMVSHVVLWESGVVRVFRVIGLGLTLMVGLTEQTQQALARFPGVATSPAPRPEEDPVGVPVSSGSPLVPSVFGGGGIVLQMTVAGPCTLRAHVTSAGVEAQVLRPGTNQVCDVSVGTVVIGGAARVRDAR